MWQIRGTEVSVTFPFSSEESKKKKSGWPSKVIDENILENQITVYFGLHFEDRFEQQLAKIFFSVPIWSFSGTY